MRVYYFTSNNDGCNYVRCWLPMWANGYDGTKIGIATPRKPRELVTKEAMASDIIVFHRPDTQEHIELAKLLKFAGKKIVFDNDDTYILDKTHPFYKVNKKGFVDNVKNAQKILSEFIYNSDLVTTTTELLADEYRKVNPNTIVLPNMVNPKDWDEPLKNTGDKVRIGIFGSSAFSFDASIIEKELRQLDLMTDVQLVLYGLQGVDERKENKKVAKLLKDDYKLWNSLQNLEHYPWTKMEDYFESLNELRLDMVLIPRYENYFNKCKSNLKFLEASMLKIPVVASSFSDYSSPYDADVTDGVNGLLANGNWMEKIMTLVNDKKKRLEIGENAHKYVLSNYNILTKGHLWKDAYEKIWKEK